MDPRGVAGELAQERGRRDGPAGPASGILVIRRIALDQFVILLPERQLPHPFSGEIAGLTDLLLQFLIRSHHPDHVISERDDAGPREGRQVDDCGGLVTAGIREGIREDQPSFGIGRYDFDRPAGEGGEDVAGFVGIAARQVLRRRHDADQIQREPQLRRGPYGRNHGCPARHVRLHLVHLFGRLDRDPAAVKGDPLSNQCDHRTRLLPPAVFEDDQLGRRVASPGHTKQGVHSELLHLSGIKHRAADVLPLGALPGLVCEIRRGHLIRRRGDDVARERNGGGDDLGGLGRGADLLVGRLIRLQKGKTGNLVVQLPINGPERLEAIKAQKHPFHDAFGHPFKRQVDASEVKRGRKLADVQGSDLLRRLGIRPPQTLQRKIRPLPQPRHDDPFDRKTAPGVDDRNLIRPARKIAEADDLGDQTAAPLVQSRDWPFQHGFALEVGYDGRFGFMFRQAALSDLDPHLRLHATVKSGFSNDNGLSRERGV